MARLFHLSDVHFGAEDRQALDWFAETVRAEKPDAVIMTGDLTMRARHSEFEAGAAWLQALGVPVTVELGNHDIPYYYDPLRRFFRPYKRFQAMERLVERPLVLPDVAIVPLQTTARLQLRIDQSKGHVSRNALARAVELARAVPKDKTILIAAHHPLVEAKGFPETRGTRGGARALAELAEVGAVAVLTGHVHEPYDVAQPVGEHCVRLIGAGTISRRTRHSPAAFNELRIEGGKIETIVRTRSKAPDRKLAVEAAGVVDAAEKVVESI